MNEELLLFLAGHHQGHVSTWLAAAASVSLQCTAIVRPHRRALVPSWRGCVQHATGWSSQRMVVSEELDRKSQQAHGLLFQ